MNQKEATFRAICQVTNQTHAGEKAVSLSSEQRNQVLNILVEGFKNGSIELSSAKDEKELKKYATNLLDNWIRKDKRLNGNIKYEIKNKGSRTGSKDDMVKELRKLLKTDLTDEVKSKVEAKIKERLAEIKPVKTISIDNSVLPQDIIDALNK